MKSSPLIWHLLIKYQIDGGLLWPSLRKHEPLARVKYICPFVQYLLVFDNKKRIDSQVTNFLVIWDSGFGLTFLIKLIMVKKIQINDFILSKFKNGYYLAKSKL